MTLIDEFLVQYNKEFDFYTELARIGNQKLESELNKRGIKAIVSYRAKRPDRLKDKLSKRSIEKEYKTVQDIFDDVIDLAGIRVALYFPTDRTLVDEIIKELFDVKKIKRFPNSTPKPDETKRFSGYWATHYRVVINHNNESNERYYDTQFEIQVASVLMHAWAEVEHDLVYKPLSGKLSDEELSILDEINGLVLTGEIALERLQKAMLKRTQANKEIGDKYELTNFIVNSLNKNYINKLKLGDTKMLNNYFKTVYKYDTDTFTKYIENINQSAKETISDQLINMFIKDYYEDNISNKSMKDYFHTLVGPNNDITGFESFIKMWIILEKGITIINEENDIRHKKYFIPKFDILLKLDNFNNQDIEDLNKFRQIRNQLIHGIKTPTKEYTGEAYIRLRDLTEKCINSIQNLSQRLQLFNEYNNML